MSDKNLLMVGMVLMAVFICLMLAIYGGVAYGIWTLALSIGA